MIAIDLWAQRYRHISTAAVKPHSPEHLATLRNTLGPDALRAESFYVHPETGKTFGCESLLTQGKAKVWPVSTSQPQPIPST